MNCFRLPDLGEGLADAELLHWLVAVGDTVALNQVIAEVETAKAAVELPSPFAGVVSQLHAAEGEVVAVGAPLITVASSVDERPEPAAASEPAAEPEPAAAPESTAAPEVAEARTPVLVGYGATSGTTSRRPSPAVPSVPDPPASPSALPPAPAVPSVLSTPVTEPPSVAPSGRPLAKPLVRKLARDRGVDLGQIRGTGTGGIVTRQDVLDHLPAPSSGPAAPAGREERVPIRGVRRSTAAAMVRSAFTAPQVTVFHTVDVTPTMGLLRRLRGSAYFEGVHLTVLTFVAQALLSALRRHPTLNSAWDEAAQEIVLKRYVNLGIATATPRGLMVPNIKDAGELDLVTLARALQALTETARAGHATPADLTGGTISITNVGVFGVDTGTPLLNPGEAAILCLGAVREQPWVHEGAVAVRSVTTLGLSFDHRLVDGEQGARFLADIAATLARA